MPRDINISNLRTEKEGIKILKELMNGFIVPTTDERRKLYELCGIDYRKYSKSIDGIQLLVPSISHIKSSKDFLFIEIKTTKAQNVTSLPFGVFFGFTKNEEDLFKSQKNYRLCLVHIILREYYCLKYREYRSMIQNKRIQYQINFRSE